jgi:hypothetical protein
MHKRGRSLITLQAENHPIAIFEYFVHSDINPNKKNIGEPKKSR